MLKVWVIISSCIMGNTCPDHVLQFQTKTECEAAIVDGKTLNQKIQMAYCVEAFVNGKNP